MGKPKRFKKLLSFFLAFLMLLSSLTVGFTAFAANEHPENQYFKDAVTDIHHPSNNDSKDTANSLEAIAQAFVSSKGGAPTNAANYQGTQSDAAKALSTKMQNQNQASYKPGTSGWTRGTWLEDDDNGTMLSAVSALWKIVFSDCLTENQVTGSSTYAGISDIYTQVINKLKANMGSDYNSMLDDVSPWYMSSMLGVGGGNFGGTNNWPTSDGNATQVFVNLKEAYYLWNAYGDNLDNLSDVITTKYAYYWRLRNAGNVFSKKWCVGYWTADKGVDFLLVNSDELKNFKKVFIADDGTNYWDSFNKRDFSKISPSMQLKLVEELESAYNSIKNTTNTKTHNWNITWREDPNNADNIKNTPDCVEGTYNLSTDHAATQKIFEHFFTSYSDFNADLEAFYLYMVQQYIDSVNKIKDSLYNADGSEKNVTDRKELSLIKQLIADAQVVYNNIPDSVKNNASVKATLSDASSRYNTYNIRFISLWNTMVGKSYIETGKALEPYAPSDYVIKSDTEARDIRRILDEAESLFVEFLPEGTDYKNIANPPYSITDSNVTISKITDANTTYKAALTTYEEYMYRRFLEIAREQFKDYYTTEPQWSTIQIPTNLNIFSIIPVRSQVSKVLNAYESIADRFKGTASSGFFVEIARRLNVALEPLTSNEKFEKDNNLYQLVYPVKDVQVDKNSTLSKDEVNTLISNLDTFLVSKTFRDALLDGYTADQFIDILLQGYYVDNSGVKHYGVNEDGTTKTEGLLTGKSGNNIANMLMSMLMPMVQSALKDVDLSTIEGVNLPLGLKLNGSAYDLQRGNATAGAIALTPDGYLLCGDPDDVADYKLIKNNEGFLSAARGLIAYGTTWEAVDWSGIDWKIDDTNEFFEWVGAFLSLIDRIAAAIFFDYTYGYRVTAVNGIINQTVALESTFKPSSGYAQVILPFLSILGVDTSNGMDTQTLKDLSYEDNGVRWDTIIQRIGNAVLNWAKDLVTNKPVSKIIEILPNLGYMLLYDKVTWGVDTITYTLDGLSIKWRDLLGQPDTFKLDSDFVTGILTGLMGEDSKFNLPALDWAKLSYLGDYTYITTADNRQQKYIDAYAPDVLVFIVYYLASIVTENSDFLLDLAGEEQLDPSTGEVVPNIFRDLIGNVVDTASKTDKYGNAREFGSAIFKLVRTYAASDYDWNNFSWKQSLVDFAQITLFTRDEVVELIDTLSEIIGNLIPKLLTDKETGAEKTIEDVLNELIYKSSIIDSLFNGIYGTFGSDLMQTVLKFVEIKDANYSVTKQTLSIDTSIATIRTRLQEAGFTAVAQKLAGKDSYTGEGFNVFDDIHCGEKIDPKDENSASYNDDWGISNANQFKAALKAILTPFNDLIGVLLAGGNGTVDKGTRGYISVANAVTVVGANGYANSLKALLDSIGCPTMSASDFSRQPSAALSNLIDMIFATVNLYCDDPLNSILSAIPGLAAFIDNKGLQTAISQIISPLNNVIGAVCDLAQIDNTDPKNHNVLDHQGIFRWAVNDLVPWLLKIETEDGVDWANLQNEIFDLISSKLPDIKLDAKDENGNKIYEVDENGNTVYDDEGNPVCKKEVFPLTIPRLDWADIAGSGTQDASEKTLITGDNPGTLVKLVRFIWDDVVVGSNKDTIERLLINLLGNDTYSAIIENINFFDWSGDKVLAIIIKIFKGLDSSAYKGEVDPFDGITLNTIVDMIAGTAVGQITPSTIVYPTNPSTGTAYGSSNVKDFVSVLTNIAMTLLENYADFDLSTLAKDGVYTSDLVASVAKVIYPLFDNGTVASVFSMIGVNVFNVNRLGGLLKLYDYNDVSMIVELPITEGEGLTSADYPGETSRGSSNWIYTAQLDANGKEVTVDKVVQYEWANRFWAKDANGAYILEDGKHVMSYWEKNEDGTWKLDANKNHVVREKKLSDINWDYCVENKLFHVYVEGNNAQSRANLSDALTTILTPFYPFVNFLLNSGEIKLAGIAPLVGSDGYANAIYPLLKLLGCDGIVAPAQYKSDSTDQRKLVSNIIDPLLLKVDEILNGEDAIGPVRAILNMIPDLANFIDNGGIQKLIYTLIYPIGNFVDNILTVIMDKETLIYDIAIDIVFNSGLIGSNNENKNVLGSILGSIFGNKDADAITFATLHKNVFTLAEKVVALLKLDGFEINAVTDKSGKETALDVIIKNIKLGDNILDLTLTVPAPDFAFVAGIGPGVRNDAPMGTNAVKKRTDSFMAIMQYLWKIVQVNKDTLVGNDGIFAALLGNAYGTAAPFIKSVLDVNITGINSNNYNTDANKAKIIASANEIVAALIQFTESTDSSGHDVSADWDTFFEYSDYDNGEDYAITYPVVPQKDTAHAAGNYTEDDVTTLINTLTTIIQKALSELLGTTVEGLVIDALYTNDIVAQISKLVCSLADNAGLVSILSMFGVDLSAEALYDMLNSYGYVELAGEIKKVIDNDGKLSDLQWFDEYEKDTNGEVVYKDGKPVVKSEGISKYWYVESGVADGNDPAAFIANVWNQPGAYHNVKFEYNADGTLKDTSVLNAGYRFTRALVVALSPFSGLINVLFNADTGDYFGGAISITGTRGYRNAIKPILDVLGCESVTKEQFVLDANGRGEEGDNDYVAGNVDYVLYNILNPVINKIGTIMDDPLNQALDLVTSLAAFVDKGGLQKAIEELLYPITQMFGPIIKLATRGVPELEGSTDIFSIALSFVDLGDGVTWNNLHTMLPTIIQSFLTIRVMDKQVNGKYVKVLSRQVVNDQEKVETQYYTVTTESKPVLDEDGNEVTDEDGNTLYQDEEVETIVAASKVAEIVGIEINGTIYKLDIDGIKIDLANLAYCMINAMASDDEDASTFAARAGEEVIAKTRRSDAFVALYRFIRRAIDANADDFIMPLVENSLPASTYDALDEYIENVVYAPDSDEKDNILITLIRIADSLGTNLDFDVEYDAWGKDNANSWLSLLQITAAKAVNGEYTDKTTQADTARAITTIWGTVNNVITQILFKDVDGVDNLSDFAVENFMNNELLSTIAKGVFSLADNEKISSIFNILNVTMNKAYIVERLNFYGYVELATNISNFEGKLADIPWFVAQTDENGNKVLDKDGKEIMVPSDSFGKLWYIDSDNATNKDDSTLFEAQVWNQPGAYHNPDVASGKQALDVSYRFSRALVVVLSPFSKLIEVLTTENNVDFGNDVTIKGSYGYTSAIKPFLDALGCDTIHRQTYRDMAKTNSDYAIYNIINPLISRVNDIMHYPVRNLLSTLPTLANFINVGGIQKAVENLLYPIVSLLNPVVDLIMDDFGADAASKSIYDVAIEFVDTALLDGMLAENGFGWSNIHSDISKLVSALMPTLYTVEVDGKIYKATRHVDENDKVTYTYNVLETDEDGNDVYVEKVTTKVKSTENGILINGVIYTITIPEGINDFLAELAGCQGVTAVDSATGSLKSAKNVDTQLRPDVAVTLLRFIWDDVVQANVKDLIDPLLENLVDPALEGTLENAYTDVIRKYIINEDGILGIFKKEVAFNYDGGEFVDLIVGLLNSLDASNHHAGTSWAPYIEATRPADFTVAYPDNYTSADVKTLISVITNIAMSAIDAFLDKSVIGLADGNIYTSQLVVTVAQSLYPIFDSSAVQSVFGILGVEGITLENLADVLDDAGYPRTAELVRAGYGEDEASNWVDRVVKQADEDGNLVEVKDKDGNTVTESVFKYWATEEDGYTWKLTSDGSHVMTYWVADENEEDGFAYEKYTAEEAEADEDITEGDYKLDASGNKIHVIRDKQFSDINWEPCVEGKYFKVQTEGSNYEDYRKNLVKALSVVLYPIVDLADFMFNSGSLDIYGVANLTGADGYENAIYPLLQVLGCSAERNGLVTPAQYKVQADPEQGGDRYNIIFNILNPLFSRLNNILIGSESTGEAIGPVRAVLNMVPNFALFIENGGVQKLVEELIYPIGNIVDTIIGVLSKDGTTLFNVAFDTFVVPETLDPSKHTNKDFEGTGLTERIIEKLIVAVFNPPVRTTTVDGKEVIDDNVLQWANAHENIFGIVAGFVESLSVNENGALEIGGITLKIAEKTDANGNVTPAKEFKLPAVEIPAINDLLSNLAKLGAPIPWANTVNGTTVYDGMSAAAVQRRTDAFVLLWDYIWGIVETNNDDADSFLQKLVNGYLKELIGDETFALVGGYITTILGRSADEVLSAFIKVTKALDTSATDVSATWDKYFAEANSLTRPVYPVKNYATDDAAEELYTDKEVSTVINTISGIAQSVLSAATGNTLSDLSVNLLYNDKLIATISQAICSIADNNIAQAFLPLLDIDLSIDAIAAKLTQYGYAELAAEVRALKSTTDGEADKKFSTLKWFVQDTDKNGEPIVDENGKAVMVPSELAKKWYVTDGTGFINNVWNTPGAYQNPNVTVADIDANYRFTRALVVALSPFSKIINTLFSAGTSTIFGEIELTGTRGYRNAVKPLLEALGTNPMSKEDFVTYVNGGTLSDGTVVQANQDYVIYNILNPILSKVDDIIHNPGAELFATIASLGAFLSDEAFAGKGNLQSAVEYLLTPILSMVDPIVKLATDDDDLFTVLFNILGIYHHDKNGNNAELVTWNNIHQHLFDVVAHFLAYNEDKPNNVYAATLDKLLVIHNITINDKKYTLTIPEYDLSKLKQCTVSDDMTKRASDAFVTVFRYIRSILNANSVAKDRNGEYVVSKDDTYEIDENAFIPSLVKSLINNDKTYAAIKPYLQNVLGSKNDEILVTVIRLFENLNQSDLLQDVDEITADWVDTLKLTSTESGVDYNGLAMSEITTAIDTLRTSVHNALDAYTEIDLVNFTADYLYKSSIPNLLASVIFPLSDNTLITEILRVFHIDVSRTFIVEQLEKYGYTELAAIIKSVPANEKLADLAWKIENADGDKVANPDIANLWYVEDEAGFKANVWNASQFQNPEVLNGNQALDANYRFTRALVVVVSPFRELIGVLTQAKDMVIFDDQSANNNDVRLTGEYGYSNAIKPLLEALGFDAMDGQTYRDMAEINEDYIIYNILNPILTRVDEILDMPVRSLLDTLPTLAQYLGNGGLQKSITNLLYPFTKILSPVVRLLIGEVRSENDVKPEKFYDLVIDLVANIADIDLLKGQENLWSTVHEWDKLTALLEGVLDMLDVNLAVTINGVEYPITIPAEGPFDRLANCQILKPETVKAIEEAQKALEAATGDTTELEKALADAQAAAVDEVRANTLLAFVNYIWYTVEQNEPQLITPLLKNVLGNNYKTFGDYVENLFANSEADVSTALVKLLNATDSSNHIAEGWEILKSSLIPTEVKYPEGGYTSSDVNTAVQTLSNIVTGVLENLLDTSITMLTTNKIYTSSVVNTLAKAIYTAVAGMESTLKLAGIDVSKENVVKLIGEEYGYTDIAAAIAAAVPAEGQSWADAVNWSALLWNINNSSDNFAHAVSAVLSPFDSLVSALLCSGDVNIAQVITITGANGYKNALKPLLDELGFEAIEDEDHPTLEAIIKVILHKLDEIVTDENLVGKVIDFLPGLANFVTNGGVQKFIAELIYPVTNLIDPILKLVTEKNIFDFAIEILDKLNVIDLTDYGWDNVHKQLFTIVESFINVNYAVVDKKKVALTKNNDKEDEENYGKYYYVADGKPVYVSDSKVKQMTGIAINGTAYPLTIPDNISGMKTADIFATIAGCAVLADGSDKGVDAVRSDTLVTVLRYVWEVVQANKDDLIKPLLESVLKDTYNNVKKYIVNLLDKTTADQFIEALIEVLTNLDELKCNIDWSFLYDNYEAKAVDYALEGKMDYKATAEDIANAIATLSGTVNNVIPMLLKDYESLNGFVAEKLYTDNLINTVAGALYPAVGDLNSVLSIVGINVEKNNLAVNLFYDYGYTDAAMAIYNAESYKTVDWNSLTWGVTDSETFAKALASVLSPFNPVLDFILNGVSLEIANGALVIPGDNGYVNAIKPLLTVLGCNVAELDALDNNVSLEGILNVVLNRVETILNAPVDEVLGMVAGIANFIDNGGLQKMIEELVHPITNIINPIVRLASDRNADGSLSDAHLFDIVFDVVKSNIGASDATWSDVQDHIFTIVNGFIKVNYTVVDKKNVALSKDDDGKYYYVSDDETVYVSDADAKQMAGIAINGIAYPLTIPSEVRSSNLISALAACGKVNAANVIEGNREDTLVTVLRYVWAVVNANEEDFITPLLKNVLKADDENGIYGKVEKYLTNLFSSTDDEAIVALVNTVKGIETDANRKDAWAAIRAEVAKTDVEYPEGVLSQAEVTELLDTVSSIVNNAIPKLLPTLIADKNYTSLSDLVAGELYTKSLVETIANALRGLGVNEDGTESDLNKTLKDIVGIDLTAVPTEIGTVNSKETFVAELAKVLAPFNPVVDALLKGTALNIAGVVDFGGENGYVYAIKPLLQVLGCKNLEATVNDNAPTLEAILTAVLNRVDEILADPITEVLEMLPQLANFIDKGGVQIFVEEIIYPVTRLVTPLAALAMDKDQKLFDLILEVVSEFVPQVNDILPKGTTWSNIHTKIFDIIKKVLPSEIEINGVKYPLNIPTLDFAELAGCGSGTGIEFNAVKADVFVTLFGYIWKVVQENKDNLLVPIIKSLLGDVDEETGKLIEDTIDEMLNKTPAELVAELVKIVGALKTDENHVADWSKIEAAINTTTVKYPNGVTAKDIENLIDTVSAVLDGVLPMLLKSTGYNSLQALVAGKLYTPELIETIAKALRGLGVNEDGTESDLNKTLKDIVGIDFTKIPTTVGKINNSADFARELAKVLAPFDHIIDALLNAGSLNIYGIVDIGGQNAYVDAIKPLLTVLGCNTSGIVEGKATLEGILKALLARVDEILANPVDEVVALIPQLVNFIDKGGIQTFIEELIYPVTRIISPLLGDDSQNLFDIVFDIIKNIEPIDQLIPAKATWDTIQNYIFDIISNLGIEITINGKNYKLSIPALDLKALAGCGTGNGFDYNANKADTIIVVLRYVWSVVQSNKTGFLIPMLKELLGGNYKNFGQYIETLLNRKDDDVIKALVDVLKNLDASGHKADWSFLYKNYKSTNVKYPNGVTSKDLEQVVQILTVAVNNALQIFLGKSLDDLVPELIYTDSLINTIAKALNSLKNNKDLAPVFEALGVDFSKVNYNQKWNVKDQKSFVNALATILSPFNNVLAVLLNEGTIDVAGIVEFTGANGYENAIKPLLDTLGCNTVSASRYKSDALKNSNNLLLNILNPLLNRVDEILANPVEELIDLLPQIANFINQGGVQKFVEELIYPITNLVSPIVKLVTNDSIFDFAFKLLNTLGVLDVNITWSKAQTQLIPIVNSFLTNIKINNKSYSINIPNIDWSILAGCGKVSGNSIKANQGDVLMTLLRYIFKALDANKNLLFDLVGGKNSTIGQIINNVLKQGADGMAKIVVTILLKMETFDNVQWTFKNIKELVTEYTEHLGEEDYYKAIGMLDDMIAELLDQFVHISLSSVLSDMVYTNSIINTLAKLVYTNIEKVDIGIDLNTVLKVVDLDVSTKGVSSMLSDFGAASREIGRHAKWSDVNFDSINWGFTDGNRDGFVKALSAILRPVQPILRVILSGEDLIVLGSIQIKGGNGYNTAIIPLLEALDINPSKLVSPAQYNKDAATDKVLTDILNPLLDKVEELTNGPVDTLTKILPNIAYFVYNGGIQDIAENLIAPVTNILHEIDPIYSLNLDLSMLGDVDLAGLLNGILSGININGTPLGIVLPDIDLATLAGRGKLITYRSARTYYGKQMDCKKINADQAAVFISVLRYIVLTLKENLDNIKKLLEGLGLPGDIADMVTQILEMLTNLDVDGVIEALMELLFDFDIGNGGDSADANANKNGLKIGNVGWLIWVYWVIFVTTVLILAYFLFLLFSKKKDDEEDPENPEGPNPPEAPSEEHETDNDNK